MIINMFLQTGTKYLVFDNDTNSVAGRFPMAHVSSMSKSDFGLILLELPSTAIMKIVNTFGLRQILREVKHDTSL